MTDIGSPAALPPHLLTRPDVGAAIERHDFGTVFALARKWAGISYHKIAEACNIKRERVGKLARGEGAITTLGKICEIADGLRIPGRMLGIAARPWEQEPESPRITPDDRDRISRAITHPSQADPGAAALLADILVTQRRLDDAVGSAAVLPSTMSYLDTVGTLAKGARGPHRSAIVDAAAQWAVFAGWVNTAVSSYSDAAYSLGRALEWSAEVGDDTLLSITWSFKGYLAGQQDDPAAMLGLASVASRIKRAHPSQQAYSTLQSARAHALLGEPDEARRLLEKADTLIEQSTAAGPPPEVTYWNREPFFRMHMGRTSLILGDHADAAAYLSAGLGDLPTEQRGAEWMGKYYEALERAKASA